MITHLACMMDGNRRWAKQKGLMAYLGHRHGINALKCIVDFCIEKQIPYLSLYTLSIENLKRPQQELDYLFDMFFEQYDQLLEQYTAQGVRIRFLGDRSLFPAKILPVCQRMEQETAHLSTLNLNFLFCYGGRQEIVHSVKEIFAKIKSGELDESAIDEKLLSAHLWTGNIPEPDMVIRPGKVVRISNFLLFQAAYAEYYFLDCLWPDVTKEHLENALLYFSGCKRNFGT